MIMDAIINASFLIPQFLLSQLPTVSTTIPSGVFDSANQAFQLVAYVMPLSSMLAPFAIVVSLRIVQITVAIIVRVKSFIPTMGS